MVSSALGVASVASSKKNSTLVSEESINVTDNTTPPLAKPKSCTERPH